MQNVATYMDEQRNPDSPEVIKFNEEYEDFMFAPTQGKYVKIAKIYKDLPDKYLTDSINNKMLKVARTITQPRSGGSRRRRNISSRLKKSRKSGRKSGRKSSRRHNKKSSRRYRR